MKKFILSLLSVVLVAPTSWGIDWLSEDMTTNGASAMGLTVVAYYSPVAAAVTGVSYLVAVTVTGLSVCNKLRVLKNEAQMAINSPGVKPSRELSLLLAKISTDLQAQGVTPTPEQVLLLAATLEIRNETSN